MAGIKRIEGKGGVSYKITVSLGRDSKGKQIRHYMTWKPDRPMSDRQMGKAVQKAAFEFERDIELGFQVDNQQTFEEYSEYVYGLRVQRGDKPQTLERVRRQTARINQYIGGMRLRDIRPQHLNAMYRAFAQPGANNWRQFAVPAVDISKVAGGISQNSLAEECGVSRRVISRMMRGEPILKQNAEAVEKYFHRSDLFTITNADQPLAPATIIDYHSIVHTVLAQAEKEMIVIYNAAKRATLPIKERVRPGNCLQLDTVSAIVDAIKLEPMNIRTMIHLFLVTGCRRGEILAMSWDKIDLNAGTVKVNASLNYIKGRGVYIGPTKTGKTRTLSLPPETVELLRRYRIWQAERRLQAGSEWQNAGLLFTGPDGKPIHPGTANREIEEFAKRHGLPHINPHQFRHTFASILISKGIDVMTVSSLLGHANPTTTLGIYTHEIEEARRRAAECVSSAILQSKNA